MHDGIQFELAGLPAAVVCTDVFARTGRGMAQIWGAPDYPLVLMAHPLASRTPTELEALVAELVARVAAIITTEVGT